MARFSGTALHSFPMTMPSSPSNTIFPALAGRRITSSGPRYELGALIRYRGSAGSCSLSFSAKAMKLFHRAITLLGRAGASSLTWSRRSLCPLDLGCLNISPSNTSMVSADNVPKWSVPACSKRIQCRIRFLLVVDWGRYRKRAGRLFGACHPVRLSLRRWPARGQVASAA